MARKLAGKRFGIDPEQPRVRTFYVPRGPGIRQGGRYVAAVLLCVGSGTAQVVWQIHDDWMVRTYAVVNVVNAKEVANKEIP